MILGIQFYGHIMNASGIGCSIDKQLQELNESESCAIVTKSCTLEPRTGNNGRTWWKNDDISINSIGIKNPGIRYYMKALRELRPVKPQIVSIECGLKDTFATLTYFDAHQRPQQLAELNVSCPNTDGRMLGYNFQQLNEFLHIVDKTLTNLYGLKLPVYLDVAQFEMLTKIISHHKVAFVTCCNTMRGLILDDNLKPRIDPNDGIGGISGPTIKPFALANVKTFSQIFRQKNLDIKIIGCGGIQSMKDVQEFLACGAALVQMGFGLAKDDEIFKKIQSKL